MLIYNYILLKLYILSKLFTCRLLFFDQYLFEKNYENWLPKVKIIMVETHDRMVPRSAFTVMNALDKYNFMLFTTAEGTMFYYNMNLIKL